MSTKDNNSLNHNKDYDDELWSDDRLEDVIFNDLMNSDQKYIHQAITKFNYFRLTIPSIFFEFDVANFTDPSKNQLEILLKGCKTKEEKYRKLNGLFTKVIFLIYKKRAQPQILSNTKEDQVILERSINEIPALVSNKWKLFDSNHKMPISSSLYELIGYVPPEQSSSLKEEGSEEQQHNDNEPEEKTIEKKTRTEELMEIIHEKISLLFKDQYDEPFAKIYVKDHLEIISIKSHKFARFLSNSYFQKHGTVIPGECITNVIQMLQARAEFGDVKYNLSLRVAEYNEDLYYDLTNEKHQCIRISSDGKWQVLDQTPIPLFRRYNQSSQNLPDHSFSRDGEAEDPLETFFLKMTNIKDPEAKLIAKVTLLSYFIPNIPHIILMIHGGKGSAKSTFQLFIKNIVDPAKPSLLTLHDNTSEFIQQLSHNYLATYDNMKYVPRWLSDEVCKAVTGIGQTKRMLYTDDEDKIYEYKHCLNFNGINIAFSEPDVLDRSIIIELDEIGDDERKTEQEILNEFNALKPKLMAFIFDTLAKAITIKQNIKINKLPRMADYAIWGEALSIALGYRENDFTIAYYNKIGFQNNDVIDSNSLAFAIKKFVEKLYDNDTLNNAILFVATPLELLEELNKIATQEGIDTSQREWPRDRKWLVKRINIIKSNLQQVLAIKISIDRDSNNTSIIKIKRNISGNSGEHNLSPAIESLSPYLEGLSPASDKISPEENQDLSTKSLYTGHSGDTGDNCDIMEKENIIKDEEGNHSPRADSLIGYKEPFYHCKQHPNVQNIHKEEIEFHLLHSTDHRSP